MVVYALTRGNVADYVSALFLVYILIILVYIVTNMLISFGLRPPYSRAMDAVLGFLRDVSEPYLRIFRRFIPTMGMFDLSPVVGIILLYVLRDVLTNLIN